MRIDWDAFHQLQPVAFNDETQAESARSESGARSARSSV